RAIRTPIMAITTSNSTSVKPTRERLSRHMAQCSRDDEERKRMNAMEMDVPPKRTQQAGASCGAANASAKSDAQGSKKSPPRGGRVMQPSPDGHSLQKAPTFLQFFTSRSQFFK